LFFSESVRRHPTTPNAVRKKMSVLKKEIVKPIRWRTAPFMFKLPVYASFTIIMKNPLRLFILLLIPLGSQSQSAETLFASGTHAYSSYRIPSLVTTQKGTLLAFCEGRKEGLSDAGNIDIVMRRSTDHGKTWTEQTVLWDDGPNTCGNPCPVVDEETGVVWLLLTHNRGDDHEKDIIRKSAKGTRTVWVMKSDDEGETWSPPVNITATSKKPEWGWYATGPGNGIQIKHGPRKGRLVIPCDFSYDDPEGKIAGGPYEYGAHTIFSDDHGATWQLGGVITPKSNECQVVEVADGNGTLLMNMRSYFNRGFRTHSISYDGGESWTAPIDANQLVEPVCQASIVRHSWPDADHPSGILLFLNPASTKIRHNMSLRASYDDGKTWPLIRTLHAGPSAYSSISILRDQRIAVLYEAGKKSPYETIQFQVIPTHTVTNNRGQK
jgi:sialidase-1